GIQTGTGGMWGTPQGCDLPFCPAESSSRPSILRHPDSSTFPSHLKNSPLLTYNGVMNDALYDLSASQHGLLSREQALRQGLSIGQWRWLTRSEDWRRVYAGVCRQA